MAAKGSNSSLKSVFDDDESEAAPQVKETTSKAAPVVIEKPVKAQAVPRRISHAGKKAVLIHIPDDMHRQLRLLSVETEEPLTEITERMLRRYLVEKGYGKFAKA